MYVSLIYLTISKDEKDKLQFEIITSSVRVEHAITIPPGNYTELGLSQALDQQLRSISNIYMGSAYDSANDICNITTWGSDIQFRMLTEDENMKI